MQLVGSALYSTIWCISPHIHGLRTALVAAEMDTFPIDKDSPEAELLKSAIKQKVEEILGDEEESSDTLALYLVVILSRGRSRAEVLEELRSLLEASPEAEILHKW
jgi:hypothetical protein